jgi:hypothetical protein
MQQQVKYAKSTNVPTSALDVIVKQIDKMENDAKYQGFPALHKNGKRTGVAMRMPTATETIRATLNEEAIYRLLSGVAHGHTWALMGLGYQTARGVPDSKSGSVIVKYFEKNINYKAIAISGSTVLKAFARPLWNQSRYFGRNLLGLEEVLENIADKMELSVTPRFWRD